MKTIHADFDYSRYRVENDNVTPPDAANMFLYQLSFLPFSFAEWAVVRNEILAMDLSAWRDFRCTLLPPCFFNLDDEARQAIGRQGQLLQDPHWYDASLARGKELAAIPNHDLPTVGKSARHSCAALARSGAGQPRETAAAVHGAHGAGRI